LTANSAVVTPGAAVLFEERKDRRSMLRAIKNRMDPFNRKIVAEPGKETMR
jgi:hypothetical protein